MAEDVVAAVKQSRDLVVRIREVLKAVLPQSHVFEAAERFFVAFDPIRRAERHQQEEPTDVRYHGTDYKRI